MWHFSDTWHCWFKMYTCMNKTFARGCLRETWDVSRRRDRPRKSLRDRRTPGIGRASHCRRCGALQTTEVDGRPLQRRHLSEYHQRASRVLVIKRGSKSLTFDGIKLVLVVKILRWLIVFVSVLVQYFQEVTWWSWCHRTFLGRRC